MGGVIGKQGAKIKAIQDASGARMTASKDMLANSTERVVEIAGTPEAIQIAVAEVASCIVNDADKGNGTIMFQPGGVGSDAVVSPAAYLPSSNGAGGGTPQRRTSRGSSVPADVAGSPAARSPNNRRTPRNGNGSLPLTTPAAAVAPNGETVASPNNAAPSDPSLRTQNISIPSDMVYVRLTVLASKADVLSQWLYHRARTHVRLKCYS
jgi:heterogeneous nuclear rnp K-like protein 2